MYPVAATETLLPLAGILGAVLKVAPAVVTLALVAPEARVMVMFSVDAPEVEVTVPPPQFDVQPE